MTLAPDQVLTLKPAKRLLLVGWDAAEWRVIRPLMAAGKMPHLAGLLARGVGGNLHVGRPLLSPTIWTTIATGTHPVRHEVLGAMESRPDGAGLQPVQRASCRAKPFWSSLHDAGIPCHVINFPATHPADNYGGVTVSNLFFGADDSFGVHPPEHADTLRSLRIEPADIDHATLRAFVPGLDAPSSPKTARAPTDGARTGAVSSADPRLATIAAIIAQAATVHSAATWALEHVPWRCAALCYSGLHQFSHTFMSYRLPSQRGPTNPGDAFFAHVVDAAYAFHDMMLGRLLALAGPDALVILLSDHGFACGADRPDGHGMDEIALSAWHRPEGVLVVAGDGIRPGGTLRGARAMDIAPTVLGLFGLPAGTGMAREALFGTRGAAAVRDEPKPEAPAESENPGGPEVIESDGFAAVGPRAESPRGDDAPEPAAADPAELLLALGYTERPDDHAQAAIAQVALTRQYHLAVAQVDAGHRTRAVRLLEAMRTDDPHGLRAMLARIELARAYAAAGRLADCRKIVDMFLREYPESPAAVCGAGMLALLSRRPREALDHFERAMAIGTRSAALYVDMGRTYLRLRKFAEAADACGRAIDLDTFSGEARAALAAARLGLGDAPGAKQEAEQALDCDPCDPEAQFELGVTFRRLGNLAAAMGCFRRAIRAERTHARAMRAAADLYRQAGDAEKAKRYEQMAMIATARRRQEIAVGTLELKR